MSHNKSEIDRVQTDILWGIVSILEILVSDRYKEFGKLNEPVEVKVNEIRSALLELEEMF